MPGLFERICYYPVTIAMTLMALASWGDQPAIYSSVGSILAIALWTIPLLGERFSRLRQGVFFLSVALSILPLAGLFIWLLAALKV